MAISRNMMERQLRAGGGIMTLEEPRQGYFLGKIVRKAKKAVKKVVKSPLGKAAILGAGLYGLGALGPGGFSKARMFSRLASPFGSFAKSGPAAGKFSFDGFLAPLVSKGGQFSLGRTALTGLGAAGILAPFLMGGNEEAVDEGVDVSGVQPMVADIRRQAKEFYSNPASRADAGLYFMPQQQFVQPSFYAADGGRAGYRFGGSAFGLPGLAAKGVAKMTDLVKSGIGKAKSLFDDADINLSIRDEDVMTDAGLQAQATGLDVFVTPKSKKATKVMEDLIDEGYNIAKEADGTYSVSSIDEGALDIIAKRLRLGGDDIDDFMKSYEDYQGGMRSTGSEEDMIYEALRNRKAEGGLMRIGFSDGKSLKEKLKQIGYEDTLLDTMSLKELMDLYNSEQGTFTDSSVYRPGRAEGGLMDLGGYEKDYREGGFVPLGAEERADDVPARLSKNEFVFTADAVRNAGQGDIDKGAEVMQNMMDNLEAGGTISEESQGMENPAQAMFDQAQQLESRIV